MRDGKFLERILAVKEQENAKLEAEDIKPLRKTYSFYDPFTTTSRRTMIGYMSSLRSKRQALA